MNADFDNSLWSSLPVPAILLDADQCIADMNPAAEGFMNNSAKWLLGQPIWDRLTVDAPLEQSLERARENGTPLFVNDVDVGPGSRPPLVCNLQIAPVQGRPGWMILLISPRELAGRMTQSHSVKSAAKSAIGMAEMLAHEIKNPLAGIAGAAQLLSMNLSQSDLELTDLIVEETRRIVKLLEQVEQFGNLSAPERRPVNVHDVLDRARRSALLGFGAHMKIIEDYDPSLPLAHGDRLSEKLGTALYVRHLSANAAFPAGRIVVSFSETAPPRTRQTAGQPFLPHPGYAAISGHSAEAAPRPNDEWTPDRSARDRDTDPVGLAGLSASPRERSGSSPTWMILVGVGLFLWIGLPLLNVPQKLLQATFSDGLTTTQPQQ